MRYHVLCGVIAVSWTFTGVATPADSVDAPFRVIASSGTMVRVSVCASSITLSCVEGRTQHISHLPRQVSPTPSHH